MGVNSNIIGRAKTALVFGHESAARAVVSTVIARPLRRPSKSSRLVFTGRAVFEPQTVTHLNENILPIVDSITGRLPAEHKLISKTFEISIVNIAAATVREIGLSVSGFSADTAVFLAILSAAMRIPLPQDILTTGCIATSGGDIRTVKSMPSKLNAAVDDPSVCKIVYPACDADRSLKILSPIERERIRTAVINAKEKIKPAAVEDINQLLIQAVPDGSAVLGSLWGDYFSGVDLLNTNNDPIDKAVKFLACGNERRFLDELEFHLMAGSAEKVREIMLARGDYQLRRKEYPNQLGRKLFVLVNSLPPTVRRINGIFPLITQEMYLQICSLATKGDFEDTELLRKAAFGKAFKESVDAPKPSEDDKELSKDASAVLETVLSQLSDETLAQRIDIPIDTARARFVMQKTTLESYDEFHDIIGSFYLSLIAHSDEDTLPADKSKIRDRAITLLNRSFANKGGLDAAWAQTRSGIDGGMRTVLDAMTEQFKAKQHAKHVSAVIKKTLDPLNWDQRVAFMAAFLSRLRPSLPDEIRNQPPERFARHYENILQTYSNSLDGVRQLFRTL